MAKGIIDNNGKKIEFEPPTPTVDKRGGIYAETVEDTSGMTDVVVGIDGKGYVDVQEVGGKLLELSTTDKESYVAAINELKGDLGAYNLVNTAELIEGYINFTDGGAYTNVSNFHCTNFIEIGWLKKIRVKRTFHYGSDGLAFYDKDKNYISGYGEKTGSNYVVLDVPENAVYIRLSGFSSETLEVYTSDVFQLLYDHNNRLVYLEDKINGKFSELGSMNYIYVSKNGSDVNGDGSKENPFATIFHANESITDNSKYKKYTIVVGQGTYTDLQDKYSGVIYQSGSGYQGVVCKDYVYYESEDITRPDLCVISWDGVEGLTESDRIVNNVSPKCPFHITNGIHTSIKGFKFVVKNCRYAMHIETVGNIGTTEWLIDNCIIEWYGTPDIIDSTFNRPVIGCGTTICEIGVISNSVLCNYDDTSKNNHGIMQTHDNGVNPSVAINRGTVYKFINCVFKTTKEYKAGFEMRDGTFNGYDSDNCIIFENCSGLGVYFGGKHTHWRSALIATDEFTS